MAAALLICGAICGQYGVAQEIPMPSGSVTLGYRFTDVKGYQPRYTEMFGLNSGLRVMDFSLFSKPPSADSKGAASRFFDSYALTSSGFGGEPFTTTQLTVRKRNVYDLRANFRQTKYYWDRNDTVTLPGGIAGLTNNHDWATVRKLGSVNLLVHASKTLRFSFEYARNTRDGIAFTTRPIDFFGSSSTWGSFARANPYYFAAPLSETANRGTAGVDYTLRDWALHYKIGYQSFEDSINPGVVGPQRSINTDPATASATARELLTRSGWADYRKLTTPVSEMSFTGRINPRVEWRGSYIFYRYAGPASLSMASEGTARSNTGGTAFAPYTVSLISAANVTEPNHVLDQGVTIKIREWWTAYADYRYTRFSTDSDATFRSVIGTTVATGKSSNQWRISTNTLDLNTTFTPLSSLLIRGGVRLTRTDVRMLQDGILDTTRSKLIRTAWPIGSIYFEPTKKLTVRADADQITNGVSYTRVTPHVDVGGRFVVRYRPTERFYLEDSGVFRNRTQLASDFRSTVRSNATTLNYQWNEKLTVYAGFSYDSLFASNYVSFLRGTAPFTNLSLRDQTVNRVWQGGVRLNPTARLGASFTGNYLRSTGLGEIAGERPLYGPLSFPFGTGSIYYDFPKLGRLTVQLQRTYYVEQIVTSNNFSANLLTIFYTRSF